VQNWEAGETLSQDLLLGYMCIRISIMHPQLNPVAAKLWHNLEPEPYWGTCRCFVYAELSAGAAASPAKDVDSAQVSHLHSLDCLLIHMRDQHRLILPSTHCDAGAGRHVIDAAVQLYL
jgi:hypothetical protein